MLSLVSTCEVFAEVTENNQLGDGSGSGSGSGDAEGTSGGLLAQLKSKSDLSYEAAGIDDETGDVVLSEIEKFRQRQAVGDGHYTFFRFAPKESLII